MARLVKWFLEVSPNRCYLQSLLGFGNLGGGGLFKHKVTPKPFLEVLFRHTDWRTPILFTLQISYALPKVPIVAVHEDS